MDKLVHLTTDRWRQLLRINQAVNRQVVPATDRQIYGREEVWAYPTDRGDCEDFALLKRRELADAGWPVGALLMTVVRTRKGEEHAVLTVVTDLGDYVLDNLAFDVRRWDRTSYEFLKRQSTTNSAIWVSIAPVAEAVGVATSVATPIVKGHY